MKVPNWITALLLVVMLLISAYLQFSGSADPHPDERVIPNVMRSMATDTLEPKFYTWPAHTLINLNFLIDVPVSYLVFGEPLANSIDEHRQFYVNIARTVTRATGVGMVLLAFFVGSIISRPAGLLAAFLSTFHESYIFYAQVARPDIPLTFTSLLTIFFTLRYMVSGREREIAFAGASAVLSFATKYAGFADTMLIGLCILALHYRHPRQFFSAAFLSFSTFVLTLFIVSPFLVFYFDMAILVALTEAFTDGYLEHNGLSFWGNMSYYLSILNKASSIAFLPLMGIGFFSLWENRKKIILPLLHGIPYLLVISVSTMHWARYSVPIFNTVLLSTAVGMSAGPSLIAKLSSRPLRAAAWCCFVVLVVWALLETAWHGYDAHLVLLENSVPRTIGP